MFPESSFIHIVRDPVLATDDVGEKTALLMPHVFPEGQKLWCPFSRDGCKPCFLFPSLMGALSFGFSRFLKGNVSSQSQVDANISQTLATESEVSEDFWNVWAWLPSYQAYVVPRGQSAFSLLHPPPPCGMKMADNAGLERSPRAPPVARRTAHTVRDPGTVSAGRAVENERSTLMSPA